MKLDNKKRIFMNITPLRNDVSQNVIIGTTEQDHLSNIPKELFKEITNDLSFRDMRALSLTNKNIFKIVDSLVLLKTQYLLENLESSLILDFFKKPLKKLENLEKYNDLKFKSKAFPNGSKEKCQALRDLICMPFKKRKIEPLVIFRKAPSLHDDLLITQLIQTYQGKNQYLFLYINCLNKDHVDALLLYLNALIKNQIQPDMVRLRFKGNPCDSNVLELFLRAVQVNLSITNIELEADDWDFLPLGIFLDGIKNVKHLDEVTISNSNWTRDQLNELEHKLTGGFKECSQWDGTFTYKRLQAYHFNEIRI